MDSGSDCDRAQIMGASEIAAVSAKMGSGNDELKVALAVVATRSASLDGKSGEDTLDAFGIPGNGDFYFFFGHQKVKNWERFGGLL